MAKLSITRRLIISVLLTELLLTVAVLSLAMYVTGRQLRRSLDAFIQARAMSIGALVRFAEDEPHSLYFDSRLVPPPFDREHPDFYEVLGSDGKVIVRSSTWPTDFQPTPSGPRPFWTTDLHEGQFRAVRFNDLPVLDREGPDLNITATITVIYGASTDEMRERAWTWAMATVGGSFLILGLSTIITVWAVRKGLEPLAELTGSARRVNAANWKLDASDQARSTVELTPLTDAMDSMLLTLEQAFTLQRDFVTNAAHELKTPVAILKSTLQLLLQRPRTAEEYRAELEVALQDVDRLEALTHSMLRLARAEQVSSARRSSLPLIDVVYTCEQSAKSLESVADAQSVRIEIQSEGEPKLHAEPEDLELIWKNLLENAIRYSPKGSTVVLRVKSDQHHTFVDVSDSGPGIPVDDLQNIFNRFQRLDASRSRETGGYGLGLAIVKAMVEAYGGTISAASSPGTGTTMSVILPAQS